jgi:hypothetical protein
VKRSTLTFLLLGALRIRGSPGGSGARRDLGSLREVVVMGGALGKEAFPFKVIKTLFYEDTSKDRQRSAGPVSVKSQGLIVRRFKPQHYLL